jgi:dihydroorotase
MVDLNSPWKVEKSNILYKCAWSPFEEQTFTCSVIKTIINGKVVFENGTVDTRFRGERLAFER